MENTKGIQATPQEDDNSDFETALPEKLFNDWLEDTIAQKLGKETAEQFAKERGLPLSSPYVMMFVAFTGGLEKGLDVAEAIFNA